MILRVAVVIFLMFASPAVYSQETTQMMVAVHADLIKSDNDGLVKKMQSGIEAAFYPDMRFAATVAAEWWTSESQPIAIVGARVQPIDEAFIRARWLINKDASIGAGFAKPLSGNLSIEAITDFYFDGNISIRGGVSYKLRPSD